MVRVKEIKSDTELRNEVGGEQICYHPQIEKLTIGEGELTAFLSDGRKTTIPISWFKEWGHKNIKPEQLKKYEIWEDKKLVYFSIIDAHVGVEVFTEGLKAICPNCH